MSQPLPHHPGRVTVKCWRSLFFFLLILVLSNPAKATCNAAWTYTISGDTVFLQSTDTISANHHFWSFNGVYSTSNLTSLSHIYTGPGTYHICQLVYTPGTSCSDSLCQDITIPPVTPPCTLSAAWTYTIHGDSVFLQSGDTSSANHHYWAFSGSSSGSNATTLTHVYTGPGTYHICLYVYTLGTNCTDSFCQNITIQQVTTHCNLNTAWTYVTRGDTVFVTASDTNTLNHHYWTFNGVTNTSNSLTASYVFTQPGTYHVCLHEYTPNTNCVDSFCQAVSVTALAPCTLTAAWQSYSHGDTVYFYASNINTSAHYFWNFGDGSPVVSGFQVSHVYANAGNYHACLYDYIPNTSCTDSFCQNVSVTVAACHVSAAWTYTIHGDTVLLQSSDTSSANHHIWTFGSTTSYASGTSVVHVFPNYGTYHICLNVYAPGTTCSDSSCNNVTIVAPCTLSTAWTYSSHSGDTVHFYSVDTTSAVHRYWTFGDGSAAVLATNPVHTYATAGTYHVCLHAYLPGTACADSFCSTITVGTTCHITAAWQSTVHGDTVHFYAVDTNTAAHHYWSYGDGTTSTSGSLTSTHIYSQPGTYHVCFYTYIPNTACIDSFCNTVTIAGGCHVSAAWTYTLHGDTVYLTSADTSSSNHHYWIFGGNTSTYVSGTTATHVYTGAGTYHICLYVYTPGTSCTDSSCNNVTIANTCNVNAAWQSYTVGDTAHFYAGGNTGTVSYTWSFGDGHSGTGNNPLHVYAQAGTYHVCLHAYTGTNCVDSFCNTVTVAGGCHVSAAWSYTLHGDTIYLTSSDTSSANHHYWIFNGNTANYASGITATHIYTGSGTYHICLYVYTPGTTCSDSSCNNITIANTCNVHAAWQSYTVRDSVHFYNNNNDSTVYLDWNFGDGNVGFGTNPWHGYATAGTYHVCCYAYTAGCIDSFCNTVTVGSGCHVSAAWSYTVHGDTVFLTSADTNSANHHYWTFGTPNYASGTSVTHVYTGAGTYQICLHVYTPGTTCSDSSCNTVTIASSCNVTASWQSYSRGDTAHFYASGSTTGVAYSWTYGDGTTGTGSTNTHVYAQAGTYHVCLHATIPNTNCIDSFCNTVTVGSGCHVSAAWSYTVHGDTVYLTSSDTSSANHHFWIFDGNTANYASGTTATHIYTGPGTYHICLYVYTLGTTCNDSSCNNITITNHCTANAAWTSHDHGDTIHFAAADTSSALYLDWNFGDGSYGYGQYPTHVYAQAGTYHVCLYAYTGSNCIDSFCNTVTIGTGCHVSAAWTYTLHGDTVYLTAADTSSTNHHYWVFGGSTVTYVSGTTATHIYTGPGTYNICLYVYTPGTNCIDSSCNSVTIANTCNVNAAWQSYTRGDTAHFYAGGNTGTVSYSWIFGDGHSGTGSNPLHVYAQAGTYHVCLYAYTGTNCIDSFCNTITVSTGCNITSSWTYQAYGDSVRFDGADSNTTAHHYWSFGDGYTGSGFDISHTYSAPGTYHVCHYVYIPSSACIDSSCNDITVAGNCSVTAALNFINISHDTVAFYALFADSATNFVWIYGDGTTSTGAYAVHGYHVPGTYHVCLHVFIPGTPCSDSVCVDVNVGASCAVTAAWASIPRGGDSLQFYAADPDTNAVHRWTFGDGTTGTGSYAAHKYPTARTYHVCLFVSIPNSTCSDSLCKDVSSALGINDIGGTYPTISLRPNPFSQYTIMNIDGPASTYEVRIYDVIGQQVRTVMGVNNSIMIDRGNLTSGIYTYSVIAGSTMIGKGKMSIE